MENDFTHISTGGGSSIEGSVSTRIGGATQSTTWEALWDANMLQFDGGNSGSFSDHFTTSGTGADYTLTSVPEPSSAALLGLGGLALILRRRK